MEIEATWLIPPIWKPLSTAWVPINPFIGRIPDAAVFALRTAISF
jgi:hypothetical protein